MNGPQPADVDEELDELADELLELDGPTNELLEELDGLGFSKENTISCGSYRLPNFMF